MLGKHFVYTHAQNTKPEEQTNWPNQLHEWPETLQKQKYIKKESNKIGHLTLVLKTLSKSEVCSCYPSL